MASEPVWTSGPTLHNLHRPEGMGFSGSKRELFTNNVLQICSNQMIETTFLGNGNP